MYLIRNIDKRGNKVQWKNMPYRVLWEWMGEATYPDLKKESAIEEELKDRLEAPKWRVEKLF